MTRSSVTRRRLRKSFNKGDLKEVVEDEEPRHVEAIHYALLADIRVGKKDLWKHQIRGKMLANYNFWNMKRKEGLNPRMRSSLITTYNVLLGGQISSMEIQFLHVKTVKCWWMRG